jgi:MFS family permease
MSFLDRSHTIAKPGYSRWMVPPAALCVHLCIGQAYAFSVFNLPMTKLLGVTQSAPDDWKLTDLGWIFSLAIFFLGVSSALFGRWVEEGGPRRAMFTAALCWAGGFFISALGVYIHNLWVIYIGYGVIGGVALGIGYISPISTLIRWFPDRPGMATGMAIMGFGGGAFIAAPLSVWLMSKFSTPTHVGVAETFITMGAIYLVFMMVGAIIVRVPAPSWRPAGYTPPQQASKLITTNDVFVYDALKTPQFWLIWWILCLNVTAGIGVLGQASAMSQEMFPGRITPIAAAGFVGLMSLFNMGGRFFWASTSDYIGRKEHLFRVHGARLRPVLRRALYRRGRQCGRVRPVLSGDHKHVRWGLRHRACLPQGHVRHALCGRHPRPAAYRMVDGRHLRTRAGQLHPRV